jgi:plasmid stabilization system protein ParE
MKLVWTRRASQDLVDIRDFLARTSPVYATTLAKRIIDTAEQLKASPQFGSDVSEFGDPNIRDVYFHPY